MENAAVVHPTWCAGAQTTDGLHASEWEGWGGEVGHLVTRDVGDDCEYVEVALYDAEGGDEAVIRVPRGFAYELLTEFAQALGYPPDS